MTQDRALELIQSGANIFLSGPPGSGKSFVLEQFMRDAHKKGRRIALTATTGIAASLLGGMTLHSWSGFRANQQFSNQEIEALLFNNHRLAKRLVETESLIIDEISMLDAPTLDGLDRLLKTARADTSAFGGMQVILSGDFFQLPPVSKTQSGNYCFLSRSWAEAGLISCYLSEQHRQAGDELSEILAALRERRFSKRHLDLLSARQDIVHPPTTTVLMTHNRDVDLINHLRLEALSGSTRYYQAELNGPDSLAAQLARSVLAPKQLPIKLGAAVMFVANDPLKRYVNGSQGKVVGFRFKLPVVELKESGNSLIVEAHSWKLEADQGMAELIQLPLKLAWAITIHKCQGMSLESADIDLKRSFTYGMGYVALSRLKHYKGLYLRSYNSRSLQLDKAIYEFDASLRKSSKLYETSTVLSSSDKIIKALYRSGMSPWLIRQSIGFSDRQLKDSLSRLGLVNK